MTIIARHVAITDPRIARDVANVLERSVKEARRSGINRPDLAALVDELRTFSRETPKSAGQAAFREGPGTGESGPSGKVATVSAAKYAELNGRTKRAVTERCRRGTLPAELTPAGWRIFIDIDQED